MATWYSHFIKTVNIDNEEEAGDPTDPTKEPTKKVKREFLRNKWEE
jgi:hypothetical protein